MCCLCLAEDNQIQLVLVFIVMFLNSQKLQQQKYYRCCILISIEFLVYQKIIVLNDKFKKKIKLCNVNLQYCITMYLH